jgi:beta-glucosidase
MLIDNVSAVNRNIVVVLNAGAAVTLQPWIEHVSALLWTFFPGQEGTEAINDVLRGSVNPSGKMPFTIGKRWEDYPAFPNFPGKDGVVKYEEGILVGYRYFDTKKIEPAVPFGFGISYTTFEFQNLAVKKNGSGAEVTVTVKNSGTHDGAEVVQVYVHDNNPPVLRPEKELKAFAKIFLKAGEERTVTLHLPPSSFEYFDPVKEQWVRSKGSFTVLAGNSSMHVPLQQILR